MKNSIILSFIYLLSIIGSAQIYIVALDGSGDFTEIQSALDAAHNGDWIVVRPGLYFENVEFRGDDIVLTSENSSDWTVVEQTIIKAKTSQSVVTFSGHESSACRLQGFTIQDGFASQSGGGIYGNSSQAITRRCIIKNNTSLNSGGGFQDFHGIVESCLITGNSAVVGAAAAGCQATFINCVVTENQATSGGIVFNNCDGTISLCTVANNTGSGFSVVWNCDGEIKNSIFWDNPVVAFLNSSLPIHCCFPSADNTNGNINLDPKFVLPGDYHLRIDSPCIDAGDSNQPSQYSNYDFYGQIRFVDGIGQGQPVVDMGAAEFDPAVPLIALSHHSMEFKLNFEQTTFQTADISIANAGGGQFDWIAESTPSWLTVSPDSGTCIAGQDSNIFTLIADANGLQPGRYSHTLVVNAPQAVNPRFSVSVELLVVSLEEIHVPQIFPTIQEALDAAVDGSRIIVADGIYTGAFNRSLDFSGKQVILKSENGPENCTIDCQQQDRGFYFHSGEDENSVVKGFTIKNGYIPGGGLPVWDDPSNGGGGMLVINSSPSIINCRFILNQCGNPELGRSYGGGGGILLYNSDSQIVECTFTKNQAHWGGAIDIINERGEYNTPIIKQCLITGNTAVYTGAGIYSHDRGNTDITILFCTIVGNRNEVYSTGVGIYGYNMHIKNSILWSNGAGDISAQIHEFLNNDIMYSCVQGWTEQFGGDGNISQVPKFVQNGYWAVEGPVDFQTYTWLEGDYHLQTEGWRWDRQALRWTYDIVTSPCIDTGNPADELGDELLIIPIDPQGIFGTNMRVNMGAYGQTDQASLALGESILLTDMTNDGTTDLDDLLIFADQWLRYEYDSFVKARGSDFTRNNVVNYWDMACLSEEWMEKKRIKVPVAHWTFDEDWQDTTGNYPAIPSGGALINHSYAKVGSGAAYFNGIDGVAVVEGFKGISGQSDRTVCFWMNSTSNSRAMIGWGSYEDYGKWVIRTNDTGQAFVILQGGNITGSQIINDGLWHHVAVVLNMDGAEADVSDITIYVDGQKVSTIENICPIDTDAFYDVSIGWFEFQNHYSGFIDDLRIYDTALYQWQISDIMSE